MPGPFTLSRFFGHAFEGARRLGGRQPPRARPRAHLSAALAVGAVALAGCALLDRGEDSSASGAAPDTVPSEPVAVAPEPPRRVVDLDSLSAVLLARADTTDLGGRAALETEIRDWLARLEFGDPELVPAGEDALVYLRPWRGRLLDALGWLAFRARD